jgi:hypothetical protein
VTLCLPASVVHARTDRRKLDRAIHHLPGAVPEASEEIENHAPVAGVISVGHDAVSDHQWVSLNPHEHVAVDVFNYDFVGVSVLREPPPRGGALLKARAWKHY